MGLSKVAILLLALTPLFDAINVEKELERVITENIQLKKVVADLEVRRNVDTHHFM